MIQRMKQRGFTLAELMVALAITSVLVGVATGAIYQTVRGHSANSGTAVALGDIDRIVHYLTQDIGQGQITDLVDGAPAVSSITVWWQDETSWAVDEESISHYVAYCFNQTCTDAPCDAESTSELRRDCDGEITTVGRYLTNVEFSLNDRIITVSITSSSPTNPEESETRDYKLYLRPDEEI